MAPHNPRVVQCHAAILSGVDCCLVQLHTTVPATRNIWPTEKGRSSIGECGKENERLRGSSHVSLFSSPITCTEYDHSTLKNIERGERREGGGRCNSLATVSSSTNSI